MGNDDRDLYFFGEYTLNSTYGCVRSANRQVQLRAKSFDVLTYLVRNAGRLVSKDELAKAVWRMLSSATTRSRNASATCGTPSTTSTDVSSGQSRGAVTYSLSRWWFKYRIRF